MDLSTKLPNSAVETRAESGPDEWIPARFGWGGVWAGTPNAKPGTERPRSPPPDRVKRVKSLNNRVFDRLDGPRAYALAGGLGGGLLLLLREKIGHFTGGARQAPYEHAI